jgi:hypothetical protein
VSFPVNPLPGSEVNSLVVDSSFSSSLLENMSDDQAIEASVATLVLYAELHEMDEWLKLDGKCIKEPHPKTKLKEATHGETSKDQQ